jgi:orotate phosphoribosyltransferase-like protein
MKNLEKLINEAVNDTLAENGLGSKEIIEEAYVVQAGKFDLQTELLSQKN